MYVAGQRPFGSSMLQSFSGRGHSAQRVLVERWVCLIAEEYIFLMLRLQGHLGNIRDGSVI